MGMAPAAPWGGQGSAWLTSELTTTEDSDMAKYIVVLENYSTRMVSKSIQSFGIWSKILSVSPTKDKQSPM